MWSGSAAWLATVLPAAAAPVLVTAKDFSGFLRGDGYAWNAHPPPIYTPPDPPGVRIEPAPAGVVLRWSGEGVLQGDADLAQAWTDLPEAVSPHLAPRGDGRQFFRLRQRAGIHAGVGTGCPQQGFDATYLPDDHWSNTPPTPDACGWVVQEKWIGFADVADEAGNYVRVVIRSFHQNPAGYPWWEGVYPTWEDDAIHQNDGWFHFRARRPREGAPAAGHTLRFQLALDSPYAFPTGPLELNEWWLHGYVWDWEGRGEGGQRHVFTPLYRFHRQSGGIGPWQHIPESGVTPDPAHAVGGRSYRCMFELEIPPAPTPAMEWREVEVAQNLPYTLEDRAELWRDIAATWPPLHADLCLRQRRLGFGGLHDAAPPPGAEAESHELFAIEMFRKVPGTERQPDLPNDRIAVVLAGMDYEPAGNWVAEGIVRRILEQWPAFGAAGSYAVIPIGNPDGYEWPSTHVIPYGNGCGTPGSTIHRGYIFLEGPAEVPDGALDPEALALRDYLRELGQAGFDGGGGTLVGMLDLENDLCPHPDRWPAPGDGVQLPPVYGYVHALDGARETLGRDLIARLRQPLHSPHTCCYVQNPGVPEGWRPGGTNYCEYGLPLVIIFEFDAAALYSWLPGPPAWVVGGFASPIQVPGIAGGPGAFYVHGYLDQVGLAAAGDPAWVFKQFGRDIAEALRATLLE